MNFELPYMKNYLRLNRMILQIDLSKQKVAPWGTRVSRVFFPYADAMVHSIISWLLLVTTWITGIFLLVTLLLKPKED